MIILDSSLLVSFAIAEDSNHDRSEEVMREILEETHGKVLITETVFSEVMTVVFARSKSLRLAVEFGKKLRLDASMVFYEQNLLDAAFLVFSSQTGTRLSFADCSLIALAKSLGVDKIATFDEDFKKVPGIKVVC